MATKKHNRSHDGHHLPLWSLFLALLALTAGEVVLYDLWVKYHFIPKYALVIVILIFTLPKAAIVMIYFMHLKFERNLVVILAVVPFPLAVGAVLAMLSDTVTLKPDAHNQVKSIGVYPQHGDHTDHPAPADHHDHTGGEDHEPEYGY